MEVRDNLEELEQTIHQACKRSGRTRDDVNIVAVTKYVSTNKALEAVEAGIFHIGENRVEGALEKWEACKNKVAFHFIGTLQSKKVKHVIGKYDYFHSLDRLSLAQEMQKRCQDGEKVQCFVQVNVSGEESKEGLDEKEVMNFISELKDYPAIEVIGLMTMAPFVEDPENARPVFQRLRHLRNEIRDKGFAHAPCRHLSMGMSNDFPIAIEEGATFVRIGTQLVGKEE
ncbi:YggS family pyridoxal phosphate-dependent enzyme [Salibacterium salarium]|uniref:Pyridoxal phosphate homeostasis protein n=1 Tax=Salibacterium salarium TaxID=284579 RepID=A0A428MYU4_9BACI|nr:YggS family pyridoxal phosphate-dependent enzyme [Salibacterium salarium]RSL31301.1 YggS family pyridoxal phosphate-dependent enzyme [Salibacterium salarium]